MLHERAGKENTENTTACLIKANSSNNFFKIKIWEIIIKPKEF
jgi:hypothetical protein